MVGIMSSVSFSLYIFLKVHECMCMVRGQLSGIFSPFASVDLEQWSSACGSQSLWGPVTLSRGHLRSSGSTDTYIALPSITVVDCSYEAARKITL